MFVVTSLIPCNAGHFFKITATATLLCTYKFLEQLFNNNFTPQITLPTRITEKTATLIDNIFVNGQTQKYNSGNITMSISDHLPQFIIIENGKGDKPTNKTARKTYRDYKNFDMESFKVD